MENPVGIRNNRHYCVCPFGISQIAPVYPR